jgi:hypothetical protein
VAPWAFGCKTAPLRAGRIQLRKNQKRPHRLDSGRADAGDLFEIGKPREGKLVWMARLESFAGLDEEVGRVPLTDKGT